MTEHALRLCVPEPGSSWNETQTTAMTPCLEKFPAVERVRWALDYLPQNAILSSSFGAQSAVMLHMLTGISPDIPVVLIDTGYLFPETYAFADQLQERLNIKLKVYRPELSPGWQESRYGKQWEHGLEGITRYNRMNKIEPMQRALDESSAIECIAREYADKANFLYLGRGFNFPVAREGALKLKEISYIHAEGYPAAEMKHGPIALIDQNMPVVFIAPSDSVYHKVVSNIEEVKARGGKVIAIVTDGNHDLAARVDHVVQVPATIEMLQPLLTVIPLQLLAYHMAVLRDCDVDQPRNLAKSVTVE